MDLVIDIGNSLHKMALFSGNGELIDFRQSDQLRKSDFDLWFEKNEITQAILSSVGVCNEELTTSLKHRTRLVIFDYMTPTPLNICYDHPETLGSDRIAGAVAAHSRFPTSDNLVIHAGTCLVYDFVDRNGYYWGGAISPGIEMRFKALHHFTAKLPLQSYRDIDFFTGNSTQYSIESGVINGVLHEVNGFITQYLKKYPELKVILSGGDAERLQKLIKNTIFADQKFVLKGLHKILQFNVAKS